MRTDNTLAAPTPDKAAGNAEKFLAQVLDFLAPHQARFDALLSVVAGERGLAPARLIGPDKLRRVVMAKREAVILAIEAFCPPLNVETVGVFLNLGRATVYRLEAEAKKLAQSDPEFAARLEKLRPRVREAIRLIDGSPSPQPGNFSSCAETASAAPGEGVNGALGETRPTIERQNHHG